MNEGIPYFPFDVYLDDKFDLIEAEFGLIGFAVVVKLYQRIYGGFGYYCEWTKDVVLLFGKRLGFSPGDNTVSEIVGAALRRGIFDRILYDTYHILTSRGIQKRYFAAVSRRKRVDVRGEYLLFNDALHYPNVNILSENEDKNEKTADNLNQRKEEKRKTEKRKQKQSNFVLGMEVSEALKQKVQEWVRYKQEQKDEYTETGIKNLVKMIEKKKQENGEDAVIELIDECMANGWKGIIWDRVKRSRTTPESNPFLQMLSDEEGNLF
nr:MAG TPA: protein of unknown function (DUF4373) [Caudoviricetes sp.]